MWYWFLVKLASINSMYEFNQADFPLGGCVCCPGLTRNLLMNDSCWDRFYFRCLRSNSAQVWLETDLISGIESGAHCSLFWPRTFHLHWKWIWNRSYHNNRPWCNKVMSDLEWWHSSLRESCIDNTKQIRTMCVDLPSKSNTLWRIHCHFSVQYASDIVWMISGLTVGVPSDSKANS